MTTEELAAVYGAEKVMKAHQFLYYVENRPVFSDYEYDRWCSRNGLFGGGGSDREGDYGPDEKLIADLLQRLSSP